MFGLKPIELNRIDGLYLLDIPSKGRGVFCKRDIKQGEIIEIAPSVVLDRKEIEDISLAHYAFETDNLSKSLMASLKVKKPEETACIILGITSICNHSNNPNASWDDINELYTVYFKLEAMVDIPKNTEICVSYGDDWFNVRNYIKNGKKIKK